MSRQYYVYLLTNKSNRVLYTGVTSNLEQRIYQHRQKLVKGFTQKYNCYKLVYFEETSEIMAAIEREKEIKGWLRQKKNDLVERLNLEWQDLAADWF